MSPTKVRPYFRVIANGIDGDKLRLTLLVSPMKSDDGIEFANWPSAVIGMLQPGGSSTISIEFQPRDASSATPAPAGPTVTATAPYLSASPSLLARLDGWWQQSILQGAMGGTDKDAVWNDLAQSIRDSLTGAKTGSCVDPLPEDFEKNETSGDLAAPGGNEQVNEKLVVTAVLPVHQGDIAYYKEFERALDALTRLSGHKLPARDGADGTLALDVDDFRRKELVALIRATNADRRRSETWAGNGSCEQPQRASPQEVLQTHPLGRTSGSRTATQSHEYGYYPQGTPGEARRTGNSAALRAGTAYYAVSSSPAWARVFGFVVDLTVPREMVANGYWLIGVSVTGQPDPTLVPKAITHAELTDEGFWPSSRDAGNGIPLSTGLLRLGERAGAFPRYELITLDVRRAVEADRFPGTEPDDRAQVYQAAGLTLIDRGRAEAAVRALGRNRELKRICTAGGACVDLDAEDLMIGMRFSVGMVRGRQAEKWCSLAARRAVYEFTANTSSEVQRFLQQMLGEPGEDRRRAIDEAVMSTTMRLLPRAWDAANNPNREAIVEQALGTWDGSPMSVFCGEEPVAADGAPGVEPPVFPFRVTYSLPTAADELQLPLRYGASYRMTARAVFPGGGSIPHCELAGRLNADPGLATPRRRFLAFEPLVAPTVLLPLSVARGSGPPAMGLEGGDVILRSEVAIAERPKDEVNPPELGQPVLILERRQYVGLGDRLTHGHGCRVVVPPRSSVRDLMREGVLDLPKSRRTAMAGALRNVVFGN